MTPRRKLMIGLALFVAIAFLVFSIVSNKKQENSQSDLVVNVKNVGNKGSLRISTEPRFDFTYQLKNDVVSIKPLSLLVSGTEYTLTAQYSTVDNQPATEIARVLYEDKSKATELISLTPLAGKDFTLYSTDRHHFYVLVTSSRGTTEDAIVYAEELLDKYGIDPAGVEIEVQFSRGAKEEGSYDPFAPVPAQ